MAQIPVQKTVFNKNNYEQVIDINFSQLLNNQVTEDTPSFTVDDFFQLYESLFFQIPKEGDINSHRYIIQKEADLLDINIDNTNVQALLDEITTLRQELLDTQQLITSITKK
jgi:hypothetical protein